jgi:hypothetical protein
MQVGAIKTSLAGIETEIWTKYVLLNRSFLFLDFSDAHGCRMQSHCPHCASLRKTDATSSSAVCQLSSLPRTYIQ